MATPQKKSSAPAVLVIRPSDTIALPPGYLGFNSLLEPESYNDGPLKFKMWHHMEPAAIEALVDTIASKVLTEKLLQKLYDEGAEKGVKSWPDPVEARAWVESHLKEAGEGANDFYRFPRIGLNSTAEYKDRKSGEIKLREIAAWDANNRKLNLKRLKLGRGSIIEPVVYGNLFYAGAKTIQGVSIPASIMPSFRLVGVRVLKLVSWGKGGSQAAQVDEETLKNVLGSDFQYDDLASYAEGAEDPEEGDDTQTAPEDRANSIFG